MALLAVRLAIAGAVLAFWPGLWEPFQPLKAVVLRVTGLGLLTWVAAAAVTGPRRRPDALTLAVLAWGAVCIASALGGLSPGLSWSGEVGQREGVLTALALVGLHLGAARAHRGAADVRGTLRVAVIAGALAAAYAHLQLAGLDPVRWSGLHTLVVEGSVSLRPAGPLGDPILLGVVLAATLPLLLARLSEPDSDAVRLVPVAVLLTSAWLVTLSRGVWLAALAGAAVACVLGVAAGAPRRRLGWTAFAGLVPSVAFVAWRAGAPLAARLGEGFGGASALARADHARGALRLWAEHPWLGTGPDTFSLAFPAVQPASLWHQEWVGVPAHAHAVPLQVLATLGALGALAGAAWLVTSAWAWARAWRDAPEGRTCLAGLAGAALALLVAGAGNAVGLAGAVLFAVGSALPAAFTRDRVPTAVRAPDPRPVALAAVVAGIMLVAGVRELVALEAARPMRDDLPLAGRTASERHALLESRARSLDRAVVAWPYDDLLWRLASEASLESAASTRDDGRREERGAAAERDARTAVRLAPRRAAAHAAFAEALAARARATGAEAFADSAEAAYARAEALAPGEGRLLVAHARFELERREGARALEVAQRIVGLYPEAALGHVLSGSSLILLERRAEARTAFQRALESRWEPDATAQREAVERLLASDALAPPPARRAAHRRRAGRRR